MVVVPVDTLPTTFTDGVNGYDTPPPPPPVPVLPIITHLEFVES